MHPTLERDATFPSYLVSITGGDATRHLVPDHRAAAAAVFHRGMLALCDTTIEPAAYHRRALFDCAVCAEHAAT